MSTITGQAHTATEPTKPRIQYNQPTIEPETNNQPNKPETHHSTIGNSKTEITNPHRFKEASATVHIPTPSKQPTHTNSIAQTNSNPHPFNSPHWFNNP